MRKDIKLFFALLSVCGSFALTSCGASHTPTRPETPINTVSEQDDVVDTSTQKDYVLTTDTETNQSNIVDSSASVESQNTQTNTDSTSVDKAEDSSENINSQDSQTSVDSTVDEEAEKQNQLNELESTIENQIKDKLNAEFDYEYVENVDLKFFDFEQDQQLNTTISANGSLKFYNDETFYTLRLGMPLEGEDFINISPLYYNDIVETNDLAQNYSIEDLSVVTTYLTNPEVTFTKATLDGKNWNLNMLSSAKVEKTLEQEFEEKARAEFKKQANTEYIENVDFKYMRCVYNQNYGNLFEIVGQATHIRSGEKIEFVVSFVVDEEVFNKLSNDFSTMNIDATLDLKDNYDIEKLNEIYNIINSDDTSVKMYDIDGCSFTVGLTNEHDL